MIFFVTFVLVLCKVQDIYVPRKDTRHLETVKQVSQIRIVLQNPVLLLFTICLAALTLCYINLDFMLPLQLGICSVSMQDQNIVHWFGLSTDA